MEKLLLSFVDVLAQGGHFLVDLTLMMLLPQEGVPLPMDLGVAANYVITFVTELLKFLNAEVDQSNIAEQLSQFRSNYDVFMTDVKWDSLLTRFTDVTLGGLLSDVRHAAFACFLVPVCVCVCVCVCYSVFA